MLAPGDCMHAQGAKGATSPAGNRIAAWETWVWKTPGAVLSRLEPFAMSFPIW